MENAEEFSDYNRGGKMAKDTITARLDMKILVVCLLLIASCMPSNNKDAGCGIGMPPPAEHARQLVANAKLDISSKRYSMAQQKCEKAEKLDPTYDEAPYCILAANLGSLVQSASSILSLIASQVSAPQYKVSSIDCKSILSAVGSDLEGQIAYIDLYSYRLSTFENPTFHIDDFGLAIDLADIFKLIDPNDIKVTGELGLNLKGTWDISEVVFLGATVNAVQGVLDYLGAHSCIVESTELGTGIEGIAKWIADNPRLLGKDAADTGRITGDYSHKGIQKDFLAALSYVVGRKNDMERVAPANGGWIAAVQQSASNNAVDAVVRFTDADNDGIPERISIPALADLRMAVSGIDIKTEFDNPLSKETWNSIFETGIALRNNIENGGAAVPLATPLEGIAQDLRDDHPTFRIVAKSVPNLIAINPSSFLQKPKYLRELLPVYFSYTMNSSNEQHYNLAWEKEIYSVNGNVRERLGYADLATATAGDFSHFSFGVPDAVTSTVSVDGYLFPEIPDGYDPVAFFLAADGIIATAKWPELHAIVLLDPSFGGLLELNSAWLADHTSASATFAPADNTSFNHSLSSLTAYYCLDLAGLEDIMEIAEIFDDAALRYEGNRIAHCP